jgi:hypothetical protein
MNRTDRKFLIGTLLFVCMGGLVAIGILMGFYLAEGPIQAGKSKYFLGLHRHQWGKIHFYVSLIFVILMIVHLALNWSWIKGKARLLFKKYAAAMLGLVAIAPIAILALFWLTQTKNDPTFEFYGRGAGQNPKTSVRMAQTEPQERPLGERPRSGREAAPIKKGIPEAENSAQILHDDDRVLLPDGRKIIITGQSSLRQIERETGILARMIVDKLGLPPGVSLDENLGRLRRQYGFAITEARDAVVALLKERE